MEGNVKEKLQLFRQESSKKRKKETLEAALLEIAAVGTCGMRVFAEDKELVSRLIDGELLNKKTLFLLQKVLFEGNEDLYDKFVLEIVNRMQRIYRKYFDSKNQKKGEAIYSPILDMFWNPELQMWERCFDGWHSFSAFMPVVA